MDCENGCKLYFTGNDLWLTAAIDPYTIFSTFDWKQLAKIREHGWNERLKISKCVKFESDLLKTNEDTAFKSRGIF